MAKGKKTEKEMEIKEFVSKPESGKNNMKQKAARAKHSYMKKNLQTSVQNCLKNKVFLSSAGYAILAVAVILLGILVLKLPVWLHVLVVVAQLLCGGYFDKTIFMVLSACLYVAAILVLKVIRQSE